MSTFKQNDVVTVKLTNGDELIGRFVGDDAPTYIQLKKAASVILHGDGFALGPVALTADPDQDLILDKTNILFVIKTYSEVASKYLQQTTGLTL